MATAGRNRAVRDAKERARVYQARTALHDAQLRRRRRDNWIAGIAAGVIIAGAIGGQVIFYTVGPGAPVPLPTVSPSPTPTPVPTVTESSTPTPTATP